MSIRPVQVFGHLGLQLGLEAAVIISMWHQGSFRDFPRRFDLATTFTFTCTFRQVNHNEPENKKGKKEKKKKAA